MSSLLKVLGLLFLPIAAFFFALAILNGKSSRVGKGFFIQEFDEQNIYG